MRAAHATPKGPAPKGAGCPNGHAVVASGRSLTSPATTEPMTHTRPTAPSTRARRRATPRLCGALAALAALAACGVLAGAALAFAPAARAATSTTMTIEGRGWGHGIGMSQYGADGYAQHGWKYWDIIAHYYTGVSKGKVGNVTIRVLLRDGLSSAVVTDAARYKATWSSKTVKIAAGHAATVTWSSGLYHLRVAGKLVASPAAPITFVPITSRLKSLTANDNGVVGHYRGRLRILHLSAGLEIVNTLPLESYLRGVVPRESPASWPIEALKAQAVAARSYAYRATGSSNSFDVYCTTASQMYGGADGEVASTNTAVTATSGVVPMYGGEAIVAYFFSTSGGHTENIENVWPAAAAVPYLKGVPDPYDTTSPYHSWPDNPIRRTPSSIAAALGFGKGPLRAVYVLKRGSSPRVVKALLIGDNGTATINGYQLRSDLALRDAWAYFTSLSISPTATRTIVYGTAATITGKRYPALGTGQVATLHQLAAGGAWSTRAATAKAASATLGGYTVAFSSISAKVTPTVSTQYYFSTLTAPMGHSAISTRVKIQVKPAVTLTTASTTVAAGAKVDFTGTVTPDPAAKTVWLQTKAPSATAWTDAVQATLDSTGAYKVSWTPAAAGTTDLRVLVAKSSKLVAGASPTLVMTAS
jgi:stage II sporulation protein D